MHRTLITGASSGIGRALALELAGAGHSLILVSRRKDELDLVAQACRKAGAPIAHALAGDVSDSSKANALVHEAEKLLGGIDTLIVNAGISRHKNANKLTWEHFEAIFATNVNGAVSMIIASLPEMLKRGQGQIIGVSSIAAFRGLPTSAAYCASKAALTTFLEALRPELKGHGIAVSVVSPGFVRTPLTEKNKYPMPFLMTPEKAARIIARGMTKRKPHIAFPWPTHMAMRVLQLLPASVYDFLMTRKKIET